jgi:hypothetical protein
MGNIHLHRKETSPKYHMFKLISLKHGTGDRTGVNCSSVYSWSYLLPDYKVSASNYYLVCSYQQYESGNLESGACTNNFIVVATICICIALITLTPNLQPASWVFGHFTDGSEWGSKVFSFFLGFLSVAWTMTDYDGTTQCVTLSQSHLWYFLITYFIL